MEKYEGAKCPICGRPLTAADDIVVCPECGAPHHRACWQQLGHCGCAQLHAAGKSWPDTEAAPAAEVQRPPEEKKICPACHTPNNKDAAFCSSCGMPLRPLGSTPFASSAPDGTSEAPQNGAPGLQLLLDPLGGVPPEEEIDGVPARRLGELVGRNSVYYIPRFRELSRKGRKVFPNFSAMLFDIPWFFFRKLYYPGFAVLILELALLFPSLWAIGNSLVYGSNVTFSSGFWALYYLCTFLQLGLRLAVGLLANTIYLRHCTSLAKGLQQEHPTEEEYRIAARKKGGVSPIFLYIWIGLTAIYYLFSLFTGFYL